MKKILYTFLLTAFVAGSVFAQEEEASTESAPNKEGKSCCSGKGGNRLPEAGDIGLGFDAAPLFNLLSPTSTADYSIPNAGVFVRYFLADDMAVRVNLGMNQQVTVSEGQVWTGNEADAFERVTDTRTSSNGGFVLGVGVEKRRGGKRVQGYVGADIQYSRSSSRTFYTYGNAMNDAEQTPISHNFGNLQNTTGVTDANGDNWTGAATRQLASYNGTVVGWSLNGIIGAEYFLAPKVSVGGEFKLGFANSNQKNDGVNQWQIRNGDGNVVEIEKPNTNATSRTYGIRPITGGNIILNMYF